MGNQVVAIIGERIRTVRRALKITQENFARETGYKASFVSGIENGKKMPNVLFFFNLVVKYNVNANYLFTGEEPMFSTGTRNQDVQRGIPEQILTPGDLLLVMEKSSLFHNWIMAMAAKFYLEHEQLIQINLKKSAKNDDKAKPEEK